MAQPAQPAPFSGTYSIGASQSSPLANNAAIPASTNVVYFVAASASITLPAATTAGQPLILVEASNGFSNAITIKAATGDSIFDFNNQDGAASSDAIGTALLVSDGNHHWYRTF